MNGQIERLLFVHAETDKAIMVGTSPLRAKAIGWLPRSQIEIKARRIAYNPRFGPEHPGCALCLGTVLTIAAPSWLLESRKITADAEVTEEHFVTPRCPHGEPLINPCPDCAREHREATA